MKKKEKNNSKISSNSNGIKVNILDINSGLLEYDDVIYVKIKCKDNQLLIMKDYLAIIGEINGDLELNTPNGLIKFEKIIGYYMHRHNQFNLFIKEG